MKGIYKLTDGEETTVYNNIQQISKDMVSNLFIPAIETNLNYFAQPRNSYEEDGCVSFFCVQKFGKEEID